MLARVMVHEVVACLGVPVFEADCRVPFPVGTPGDTQKVSAILQDIAKTARSCPCIMMLHHSNWTSEKAVLHVLQNLALSPPMVMVGTIQCDGSESVDTNLCSCFQKRFSWTFWLVPSQCRFCPDCQPEEFYPSQ